MYLKEKVHERKKSSHDYATIFQISWIILHEIQSNELCISSHHMALKKEIKF
jgi:hypothetical protein